MSPGEASRFLMQASFGPTVEEIARVQQIGYAAWIDDQLTKPAQRHLPVLLAQPSDKDGRYFPHHRKWVWWQQSVAAPTNFASVSPTPGAKSSWFPTKAPTPSPMRPMLYATTTILCLSTALVIFAIFSNLSPITPAWAFTSITLAMKNPRIREQSKRLMPEPGARTKIMPARSCSSSPSAYINSTPTAPATQKRSAYSNVR